ncbi:DUF1801 domain-containing protein [Planomicrobium sp. Y74]|uniref:DUF1801 domain-containing protein n=1 Tax=Planomicrobium sp. Y74 TaxID=2478977 RepID=UPI000EF487C2|nr:DUF1801 domain-containing protein [Planomicrobium sp. Y74]RLQ91273.1 DUF1801 domain-containing protein [Planomicrobium sp. Y74]
MQSKMDPQVDEFIDGLGEPLKAIVKRLRGVVFEAYPEIEEKIKWSKPSYSKEGLVCYMQTAKSHVNFGFYRGMELEDRNNMLEGDGKKMRHVRIRKADEIDEEKLKFLIWDAVDLNRK